MNDDLLTTAQAAEILGLKPPRIRQLILEGRLPAQKLGRDLFIARADLEAFAAQPRSTGRPPDPDAKYHAWREKHPPAGKNEAP